MDDLEDEEVESLTEGSKRKKKEDYKKQLKKGRNKADADADLGEDEEETVFIDNLPTDE
jgi:hypothetical protein